MAIRPPSDLVLDVAAAADPAKLQAATDRLEKARAESAGEAFEAAVVTAARTAVSPTAVPAAAAALAASGTARNAPLLRQDTSTAKAMEKLEAFFLQSAVEEMLPKEAESVYGSGFAGDVWKSMLAEQIAAEIAKSTKFGIAEMLAGSHFAASPGRGAPTTSAVSGKADSAAPGNNLPFLDKTRSPAMPLEGVLTGGTTAGKRS